MSACPTWAWRPSSPPGNWLNTPGGEALTLAELDSENRGRAGRLLDLHLHQLHPHASVPAGVGPEYRDRGPHDRRRPRARVRLREGDGNVESAIDEYELDYPVDPGQRARHLGRLRQPVLAGEVPDRRRRPRPLRPLRRGRLRGDRVGDPQPARRGGQRTGSATGVGETGRRDGRPERPHARDLPRLGAGPGVRPAAAARAPTTYSAPGRRPAHQRLRARRPLARSTPSRRPRSTTPRSDLGFRARRVFLVLGSEGGPGRVEVLLDGEPISTPDAGEDVRGGAGDGHQPAPLPPGRAGRGRRPHARAAVRARRVRATRSRSASACGLRR